MTGVLPREEPRPRDQRDRSWGDMTTSPGTPGATRSCRGQSGPFPGGSLARPGLPAPSTWESDFLLCKLSSTGSPVRRLQEMGVDSSCPHGPSRGDRSPGLARMPVLCPSLCPETQLERGQAPEAGEQKPPCSGRRCAFAARPRFVEEGAAPCLHTEGGCRPRGGSCTLSQSVTATQPPGPTRQPLGPRSLWPGVRGISASQEPLVLGSEGPVCFPWLLP